MKIKDKVKRQGDIQINLVMRNKYLLQRKKTTTQVYDYDQVTKPKFTELNDSQSQTLQTQVSSYMKTWQLPIMHITLLSITH